MELTSYRIEYTVYGRSEGGATTGGLAFNVCPKVGFNFELGEILRISTGVGRNFGIEIKEYSNLGVPDPNYWKSYFNVVLLERKS